MTSSIKYKVVLDTNVFISGAIYGGNADKILDLISYNKLDLLISQEIFDELFSKLHDFRVSHTIIRYLEKLFLQHATMLTPKIKIDVCRDPKDNMFLELTQEGKADYLITGDKDLLTLKSYKSTLIVTPKEFLKVVRK